jgi:HAD superfamily hydrolase (TIGR01509 family)
MTTTVNPAALPDMRPVDFMRRRAHPLRLVIFDCDGVIVDSERVASRLVAGLLTQQGWTMLADDAERHFRGMALTDMVPVIEARLGRSLPEGWKRELARLMIQAMRQEATAIPGAIEALHEVRDNGLPWRIASNSSHAEMRAKFGRLGIGELVAGRVHSHGDVARGKPAPDLFLATAAAEGVPAAACVVVEDSLSGARAAAAAGMDCLGYAPHSDGAELRVEGAVPFTSMFDLPGLIRAARRQPA